MTSYLCRFEVKQQPFIRFDVEDEGLKQARRHGHILTLKVKVVNDKWDVSESIREYIEKFWGKERFDQVFNDPARFEQEGNSTLVDIEGNGGDCLEFVYTKTALNGEERIREAEARFGGKG